MVAGRTPNDNHRGQDELWSEEGRRLFDEGLREFGRRHAASFGVAVLLIALLAEFPDLWLAVLNRVAPKRDDPARSELQVVADRSASGFSFTNRDSSALSDCYLTIRDGMGVEWKAAVTGRVAATQSVDLAWSDFTHNGEPVVADNARPRRVVISCYVERLEARRAAAFDARTE